jgi:hypothetical protein
MTSCEISRNYASGGGGLYITSSTVTMTSCEISSNTASGDYDDRGGGLYITSSTVMMTSCEILSNTADRGGGLYITSSTVMMTSCEISSNTAEDDDWDYGDGGGMYVYSGATVDVFGTLFSGNTASNGGDDIYKYQGTVTIHSICPAGYEGSSAAQGDALDTSGVSGPLFSFSGCTVCPVGGYSASPGSDCVACPAGTTLADEATSPFLHDAVEDCDVICPAGT